MWNKSCFLNKPLKVIQFKPELNYQNVKFNNAPYKFKTKFPLIGNVQSNEDIKKLKMTKIGLYSVALIPIGEAFVKILDEIYGKAKLKKMIITDGNGGLGGISLHLAEKCKMLNIVEINPNHANIIKHNFDVYGFDEKKYKIYNEDSMEMLFKLNQDIIILDLPWGGSSYYGKKSMRLGFNNINIVCILNNLIREKKFKCCLILVPNNFDFNNFFYHINSKDVTIYHIKGLKKKNHSYIISIQAF